MTDEQGRCGLPWTEDGFRVSSFKLIRRLEAEGRVGRGLTFHGLRHTRGTLMREAGFTEDDIRKVLGPKTTAVARHYSADADMRNRMREVAERLDPLRNEGGS